MRRIGVEFEMTIPLVGSGSGADVQNTLANVLTANGIRAISRGYSRRPLQPGIDVAVEFDSSVRGESKYDGILTPNSRFDILDIAAEGGY
jgi:hypothetical protein